MQSRLKTRCPAYYCNAVWVLGWTAGEVEQCLQELNGGTSYRTTPLTIVPFDLALRWGLLVVRLLDENEDIFVPPRFCGRSRTERRRERRRASKAKSKAIESMAGAQTIPLKGENVVANLNGAEAAWHTLFMGHGAVQRISAVAEKVRTSEGLHLCMICECSVRFSRLTASGQVALGLFSNAMFSTSHAPQPL